MAGQRAEAELGVGRLLAPVGAWASVALVAGWLLRTRPDGCPELRWRAYTAGSSSDLSAAVEACGAGLESGARSDLVVAGVAFTFLMAALAGVLRPLWRRSWHAPPFRDWGWVAALPAIAAVLAAGATLVLAIGLDGRTLRMSDLSAGAVSSLAWPAAILGLISVVAAAMSVLATVGSHGVPMEIDVGATWTPPPVAGTGICVSGGGIRAAAFALGALTFLERHDLNGRPTAPADGALERATYLASVSGGGYAAGAWRIARGTTGADGGWPSGVFGDLDPDAFDTMPAPERAFDRDSGDGSGLFSYFWARREYLRTGRGGLGSTAVLFLCTVALQLSLLAAGVAVIAWPLGILARSWPILGAEFHGADPYRYSMSSRTVIPVLAVLAVAVGLIVVRSTMMRTERRLTLDALVSVCVGAAALLAATLLGVPLLVDSIADVDQVATGLASVFAVGGITFTALRVASKVLHPAWSRLGGALLGLAGAVFGALVMRAAAIPGGALADRTWWYWLLLAGFVVVWSVGDPRWWSLFPVYRNRLRSAFAVRRTDSSGDASGLAPMTMRHEPTLDAYDGAGGPKHLVCCSVARSNRTGTGIPALSFVFGPDDVRMYDARSGAATHVHVVPTAAYVGALAPRRAPTIGAGRQQALGTVTAAIAMSGAAVTSAMGRMDVGSTNSLIAGLNVRLGAWVPNPRHVAVDRRPAKRARVNYLIKELFGWYDLRDPHLYITDGGHWDNLGVVELLRRRCETIVCIDTSGDMPGSFAALVQALDLARVECRARVDFDGGLDGLRATPPERPATSSCAATIVYLDDDANETGRGRLLFVKAQISEDLSDQLIGYSFEDPLFPNYSTADQFLGADQFRMMVRLGWESTRNGVRSWT